MKKVKKKVKKVEPVAEVEEKQPEPVVEAPKVKVYSELEKQFMKDNNLTKL